MNKYQSAFVFTCGVLVAGGVALAEGTAGSANNANCPPAQHVAAAPITGHRVTNHIEARMQRAAADGCMVSSLVQGTIKGWQPLGSNNFRGGYRPDLVVQTRVSCPDGSSKQTLGAVTGAGFSRGDLAHAIEAQSGAFISRGDHTCGYSPDVQIQHGTVLLEGVRQSCSSARGGGPVTVDQYNFIE